MVAEYTTGRNERDIMSTHACMMCDKGGAPGCSQSTCILQTVQCCHLPVAGLLEMFEGSDWDVNAHLHGASEYSLIWLLVDSGWLGWPFSVRPLVHEVFLCFAADHLIATIYIEGYQFVPFPAATPISTNHLNVFQHGEQLNAHRSCLSLQT